MPAFGRIAVTWLIFRDDVICLKITEFVVITSTIVQTIVDARPIDKERDRPNDKQQQRGTEKRSQKQNQPLLPDGQPFCLVPTEHIFTVVILLEWGLEDYETPKDCH